MSDEDPDPSKPPSRSWLQNFGQMLAGAPANRIELIHWLRERRGEGLFDADAEAMLEGVLTVSDIQVRDIMIPRAQMVVVREADSPDEFLPVVISSGHSRFPIVGNNRDNVVGILLAKDLLRWYSRGGGAGFDIRDISRPAVFVPESKRLNVLLKEFRASRNHMAIVVDEYGGVAGLVTIEDVLEQIVGEIDDEYDVEDGQFIIQQDQTHYYIKALTPVEQFNDTFEANFSDEEFDTIGGLIMGKLGRLPRKNDTLELKGFHFKVLRADNRRVHLLQMWLGQDSRKKGR